MQDTTLDVEESGEGFEAIYRSLEETVDRLETGGLSLEEAIDLYETGMRLARRCKQMLDAAELRVSELQQEFAEDGLSGIQDDEDEEDGEGPGVRS